VEPQDFQLKYANTVLMLHVYVCAAQDIAKLQKNVIRAAKGPRLDAIAAWTEIYPPGRKLGVEAEKFGAQRAMVEDFLRKSKTDVVVFHLCINTDTDPRKLGENIQRAARGPRFDDVTCIAEHYDGDNGRKVWDVIQQVVQRANADPAAKPFQL
jgi:hypothetical protein